MVIEPIDLKDHVQYRVDQPLCSSRIPSFDAYCLQGMLKSENIGQHFQQSTDNELAHHRLSLLRLTEQSVSKLQELPDLKTADLNEPAADRVNSDTVTLFKDMSDFVNTIWPYAVQAAGLIGLDPKMLIAQAALETGWGRSIVADATGSSHNLFNIKAQTGEAVQVQTTEYMNGSPTSMLASFRKYSTLADSFADYIALIQQHPRYQTALSYAGDPVRYIQSLQEAGYATDPNYADKIVSIYHGRALNPCIRVC